jgi:hypothetical protein
LSILVVVFVDQKSYINECNYCYWTILHFLFKKQTINNFTSTCLLKVTSNFTPPERFVFAGFKTTQLSKFVDLFVLCLREKFHIPRLNNYYYTVRLNVYIFLHIASRKSHAEISEISIKK